MAVPPKIVESARERMKYAKEFWHNWRSTARDEYDFICGRQWDEADETKLKAEKRPPITFNYSEKMIDAVSGAEVSNRNEVTFLPRDKDDAGAADLWTAAAKWARQECNAEDEEADAFRDMLICGMGCTDTRVDYDVEQDGMIDISRRDPFEMWTDPASCKVGLADRRFAFREYWEDEVEAKQTWPNKILINTQEERDSSGIIIRNSRYRDENDSANNAHKNQVLITCYECIEREPVYRAAVGGQVIPMEGKDFNQMRDHLDEAGVKYVKQFKNVYYTLFFSGDTLLDSSKSPCQEGFAFQFITGKRDRNKGTWYGLTRVMMDPQRWANKWLSQILHIINSNAKGGLLAETNAFVDPKKAMEEWSQPDTVTLFKEGALSGNKVKERTVVAYPSGLDKLMQFALGSLPMVTGINLEALGLANREQAGVLEQQRKQAAYGLLSPLFDAMRRYRKMQGKVLLHLLNDFVADGRLIRIGGQDAQQYLPLAKAEGTLLYDLVVDQSPNAPDVKAQTWEALMQIVPAMMKEGIPVTPEVLDYAPIPASLAAKWKQFIQESGGNVSPEEIKKLQEENQKLTQENQQIKADKTAEMEMMQAKVQIMWKELELKKAEMQVELQLKEQQGQQEMAQRQQEGQQQMQMHAEDHDMQQQQLTEEHDQNMRLTEQAAKTKSSVTTKTAATKDKATMMTAEARAKATARPKPTQKGK